MPNSVGGGQLRPLYDVPLTNVSNGYFAEGFICEDIAPELPVDFTSGLIGKYGKQHLRIENTRMGGRGKARRVDPSTMDITTGFLIGNHGLDTEITPDDLRNVQLPFQAEQDRVLELTSMIWLEKEYNAASQFASTTVLTQNTTLSGSSQFNDYNNSDPIGVFKTARVAVRANCGVPPNRAWMDWAVAETLRYHPQIYDRLGIKYNAITALTDAQIMMALGVDFLHIAKPSYNSAVEGQSDSLTSVWGKGIGFGVLPKTAGPRQVSLGYYLHYRNERARAVYRYPVYNPPQSTGIIVMDNYQFKVVDANAGYFVANAIA